MEVVAIVQARMGSSRLPGKTLADIAGKPMLAHVLDRVRASRSVSRVVVATTVEPIDQALVAFGEEYGVETHTGSSDDVLDRFYRAACRFSADVVVRITADDPFKDPEIIDLVTQRLLREPVLDYASNTIEPTFPEGLDVEAFRFDALKQAWSQATLQSEREHVTPYLWKNPSLFRLANVMHGCDLSSMRWTVDVAEDLQFARAVYANLYRGQVFGMATVLDLLEREPGLMRIDPGICRNAGYQNSVAREGAHP